MIIVESFSVAVALCVITMSCWGSWANTQKFSGKSWPIQLFSCDYALGVLLLSLLLAFPLAAVAADSSAAPGIAAEDSGFRVAAVQMRSVPDMQANIAKIREILAANAKQGIRVVAFPECALTSYDIAYIKTLRGAELDAGVRAVADACHELSVNAIVGTPEFRDGRRYNCALFIDGAGKILARVDKMHLVEADRAWDCTPGSNVPPVVFFEGVPCTVLICHDSRYPELCRLPVLAGARVVFYISHESSLINEKKLKPYRAQVQARAVENGVFVVQANAPADGLSTGSHGQSRIVTPDGNILQEASVAQEETLTAALDLSQATANYALRSLEVKSVAEWWQKGIGLVRVVR